MIAEPHYLILEYVMYGKLLAYLRDHRTRQDFYNFSEDSAALTSRDLTVFGYCVARGMEYLASKKVRITRLFCRMFAYFVKRLNRAGMIKLITFTRIGIYFSRKFKKIYNFIISNTRKYPTLIYIRDEKTYNSCFFFFCN